MKIIISARRENNQTVFFKGWDINDRFTESQDLAFDFTSDYTRPRIAAEKKLKKLKEQFAGLSDWKIEEIRP